MCKADVPAYHSGNILLFKSFINELLFIFFFHLLDIHAQSQICMFMEGVMITGNLSSCLIVEALPKTST